MGLISKNRGMIDERVERILREFDWEAAWKASQSASDRAKLAGDMLFFGPSSMGELIANGIELLLETIAAGYHLSHRHGVLAASLGRDKSGKLDLLSLLLVPEIVTHSTLSARGTPWVKN